MMVHPWFLSVHLLKSKQEREKNIISEKDMPDMTEKQQITSKESTRPLRSVSNMQNKEETYSSIANLEISSSNLRCPVICLRSWTLIPNPAHTRLKDAQVSIIPALETDEVMTKLIKIFETEIVIRTHHWRKARQPQLLTRGLAFAPSLNNKITKLSTE